MKKGLQKAGIEIRDGKIAKSSVELAKKVIIDAITADNKNYLILDKNFEGPLVYNLISSHSTLKDAKKEAKGLIDDEEISDGCTIYSKKDDHLYDFVHDNRDSGYFDDAKSPNDKEKIALKSILG